MKGGLKAAIIGWWAACPFFFIGLYLLFGGDRNSTPLEIALGILLLVVPILLLAAAVVGPPHRTRPYVPPDPMIYRSTAPAEAGANVDTPPAIGLEPWGPGDEGLLRQLAGSRHVSDLQRHYEQLNRSGEGWIYKIVDSATGRGVGCVGYWQRTWRGDGIYEVSSSLLPGSRGRGIGSEAVRRVVEAARSEFGARFIHAFTPVDDAWSNDLYRQLGFEPAGSVDAGDGSAVRYNDWRLDLFTNEQAEPVS